jgi:hypothetical protein
VILLATLLCAALAASLQVHPPVPVPGAGAGDDLAAKLVARIQQDLGEVDKQLEQAADQSDPAAQVKAARDAHVRAIADLEELIKQVKYRRGGGGGGGGGGSSSSDGKSSKPQQQKADDRSQADKAASPQEQQQPGAQPKGQTKPQDGKPDASKGQARDAATPPPADPTGNYLRQDTDARWGVLPPKMQERLMNLHVDDVPERYRTWLEAYVRELNRRDTAGSSP